MNQTDKLFADLIEIVWFVAELFGLVWPKKEECISGSVGVERQAAFASV